VRLNEHLEHPDGITVFQHACKRGLEGIVSKRLGSRYRSGRSPDWLKFKNPEAPAVKREAERIGASDSSRHHLRTTSWRPSTKSATAPAAGSTAMMGAEFEILDGTPRTYRDRKDFAMEAARFIKSKNPHSLVEVKSGDVTAVALRLG